MNTEQERAFIEWRTNHDPRKYPAERDAFMAGWDAGRAALQSQDREDAERWRKAKRTWRIFRLETLPGVTVANRNGIPWADLETQVDIAIDHARRVEGDKQ